MKLLPSTDSPTEQRIRLGLVIFCMILGAICIIAGLSQALANNGSIANVRPEKTVIGLTCLMAAMLGYLGNNLRYWSWAFVAFCAIWSCASAYYFLSAGYQYSDRYGCSQCQEQLLVLHMPLILFGLVATMLLILRQHLHRTKLKAVKVLLSGILIPSWILLSMMIAVM